MRQAGDWNSNATHAFQGKVVLESIPYGEFGLKVLGETWVSHHGPAQGAGRARCD